MSGKVGVARWLQGLPTAYTKTMYSARMGFQPRSETLTRYARLAGPARRRRENQDNTVGISLYPC